MCLPPEYLISNLHNVYYGVLPRYSRLRNRPTPPGVHARETQQLIGDPCSGQEYVDESTPEP